MPFVPLFRGIELVALQAAFDALLLVPYMPLAKAALGRGSEKGRVAASMYSWYFYIAYNSLCAAVCARECAEAQRRRNPVRAPFGLRVLSTPSTRYLVLYYYRHRRGIRVLNP